jgi:hypothetical protein
MWMKKKDRIFHDLIRKDVVPFISLIRKEGMCLMEKTCLSGSQENCIPLAAGLAQLFHNLCTETVTKEKIFHPLIFSAT